MRNKTQRWSPDTCECVFEIIYEYDDVTGIASNHKLFFVHNVCPNHEPLVKNKPKLSNDVLEKKIEDTLATINTLLANNRTRHLNDLEESPDRKDKKLKIKLMKLSLVGERTALRIEAELDAELDKNKRFLDGWEDEIRDKAVMAMFSPYAFTAQEVYDAVIAEQKARNIVQPNG